MEITIARKIGKDRYRFIKVEHGKSHSDNVQLLLTFYKNRDRVDMLLALGDLLTLGPSPLNKWQGKDDKVNCRAHFRDCAKSELSSQATETVSLDRLFTNASLAYVFVDDNWYLLNYDKSFQLLTRIVEPVRKPTKLDGLKIKYIAHGYLSTKDKISTEEELREEMKVSKQPLYIFRNYKLVRIINPQI